MKTTIREVANLAGVSISTVSRVMNAPEHVTEEKRVRVQRAIETLQYKPNAFARGLIYKKSDMIGVMVPDLQNPYFAGILNGMQTAASELNYNMMICNTDGDRERLHGYVQNFAEWQVDGVVYASASVYPALYDHFNRSGLPVVLASTHSDDYEIPSVDINDEQAVYDAVKYLIDAGHREVGMISFPLEDSLSGNQRYQGFKRALEEHGLVYCITNVEYAERRCEDAYDAAKRLMQKHPHVTAIFASADEFAMGIISALRDLGISVPEQVSVMGFDNIRMANMFIPKLSTVAQPVFDIGYKAVTKLHELMTTGKVEVLREKVDTQLMIRESTRTMDT